MGVCTQLSPMACLLLTPSPTPHTRTTSSILPAQPSSPRLFLRPSRLRFKNLHPKNPRGETEGTARRQVPRAKASQTTGHLRAFLYRPSLPGRSAPGPCARSAIVVRQGRERGGDRGAVREGMGRANCCPTGAAASCSRSTTVLPGLALRRRASASCHPFGCPPFPHTGELSNPRSSIRDFPATTQTQQTAPHPVAHPAHLQRKAIAFIF